MAFVRKLSLGGSGAQTVGGSASTYVGDINDIWTDDVDFNTIRRGDGATPGGIPIGSSGAHFTGQWSDVIAKPTTISGFGITDAVTTSSTDTFTNKSGNISQWLNDTGFITSVPAQSFTSLTGKPTTIAGYGITDAFFDGAYASLSGLPTIPTNNNQLTNGAGFITSYIDTTYTAGSGITLTNKVFSNAAPDQTVAITGTGATNISGTYPNFTINSTDTNTTYTAGAGLVLNGGNSFANTAPDQTVVLTGTGATSITGTYPNFTINSTDTNTTYVSSDFTHDALTGFVANEHIDWTSASAGTIDPSNYTDTNTTYNITDDTTLQNVGLGDSTFAGSVTGIKATAIGRHALENLTSGNWNTGLGYAALWSNTDGFSNTAVGVGALADGPSGSNNTAIGVDAGQDVTGSDNVFIGHYAGKTLTNVSNQLVIGVGTAGASLIKGDFSAGTVTFNDTYTFPSTDGQNGYVLATDGTGNLSWVVSSSDAEQDFSIHTSVFNATSGSRHAVDTSSTAVTATLPASPATGDAIFFADAGGNYATNNLIIGRNGNTIMGSATDMTVNTNNQSFGLFYNGTTWRIY